MNSYGYYFFYPTNLVARARFMIYVILTRTVCPPVQAHRRRKILNIWAGGVQGSENFGGRRGRARGGGKLFAGCKLIEAPAPNQCKISSFLTLKTESIGKLRLNRIEKYSFRNAFK